MANYCCASNAQLKAICSDYLVWMESPVSRIFNPESQNIHARFKEEEKKSEKACMGGRIEPQLTLIITWPCCLTTMCFLNWNFQKERGDIK